LSLEVLIDALAFTDVLILLSIGITLTYLTLKVPNFAHGDYATIGAYLTFTLYLLYDINPYYSIPLAFFASGILSFLFYYLVFKPLTKRGANLVTLMVASIALEMAIRSAINVYADYMTIATKVALFRGFMFKDTFYYFGGIKVPAIVIIGTSTMLGVITFLYIFLTKTKFGIAMRAAIENPDLARVLGIDVDKVYAFSWFLAGGLAGISGVFMPFRATASPSLGWDLLLRGFSATVVGGLESIAGAVIGGCILGFAEIIGIYVLSKPPINLSTSYRPAIPYLALILTLLIAPTGITGINFKNLSLKIRGKKIEVENNGSS